jgi:hypothetical protein
VPTQTVGEALARSFCSSSAGADSWRRLPLRAQVGKHKRKFGAPFRDLDSDYVKERRVYRAAVSQLRRRYAEDSAAKAAADAAAARAAMVQVQKEKALRYALRLERTAENRARHEVRVTVLRRLLTVACAGLLRRRWRLRQRVGACPTAICSALWVWWRACARMHGAMQSAAGVANNRLALAFPWHGCCYWLQHHRRCAVTGATATAQVVAEAARERYRAGWAAVAQREEDRAASDARRNGRLIAALEDEARFWLSTPDKVRYCFH